MGLSKEQLLLMDGLLYYSDVSDIKYGTKIQDVVKEIYEKRGKETTTFEDIPFVDDESLGMHKILELIQKDETLCNLEIVYPNTEDLKSTSSICVIDKSTNEVYVLFVGNYAGGK